VWNEVPTKRYMPLNITTTFATNINLFFDENVKPSSVRGALKVLLKKCGLHKMLQSEAGGHKFHNDDDDGNMNSLDFITFMSQNFNISIFL